MIQRIETYAGMVILLLLSIMTILTTWRLPQNVVPQSAYRIHPTYTPTLAAISSQGGSGIVRAYAGIVLDNGRKVEAWSDGSTDAQAVSEGHGAAVGIGEVMTPEPQTPPASTPTPDAPTLIVVSGAVNVRKSQWGEIVSQASAGEQYTITGRAPEWWRIDYNGQSCWIHDDHVTVTGNMNGLPEFDYVAPPVSTPVPTATSGPVLKPAVVHEFSFDGIEFFPEDNHPAFFVWITEGGRPTYGWSCVVYHNGQQAGRDISVAFEDTMNTGTPWTDDDRPTNCSVKFFEHDPRSWVGQWEVRLEDGVGEVKGTSGAFVLAQDTQQAYISFMKP